VKDNSENIQLKRIYESASEADGYRILVDRLWPRGVPKEDAHLDEWIKEIAPSNDLRKWFDHKADRFDEFAKRYKKELADKTETIAHVKALATAKKVCLLYGAKDTEHNQAVVLKDFLTKKN